MSADEWVGWGMAILATLWLIIWAILIAGGGYHGTLPWERDRDGDA